MVYFYPMLTLSNLSDPAVTCEMEPRTALFCYRGSVAHGMYVPKDDPNHIDDVDLMGFVIGEPQHYLGLHEWGSRGTKEYWRGHYDCVYYEMRSILQL